MKDGAMLSRVLFEPKPFLTRAGVPRSEQSGGGREPMQRVLSEEIVQLGRNASWSEKGGGFPEISKLRSYIVSDLYYLY